MFSKLKYEIEEEKSMTLLITKNVKEKNQVSNPQPQTNPLSFRMNAVTLSAQVQTSDNPSGIK